MITIGQPRMERMTWNINTLENRKSKKKSCIVIGVYPTYYRVRFDDTGICESYPLNRQMMS